MPQDLKRTKTPEQALTTLMALCAKAERSTDDARRLLRRWGVAEPDAEKVIGTLVAQRFIDDRRYAEAFVRDKMRFSNWGVFKIRSALNMRRIDRDIIAEVLDACSGEDSGRRLEETLRRKMRSIKAKDSYDRKVKLMRYGLSLGYEMEEVGDTVDKLIRSWEETNGE